MTEILKAIQFATKAHEGQARKGSGEPYIIHPLRVAAIVSHFSVEPHVVIAALLHDTVEDCGVDLGVIDTAFGPYVGQLVDALTDPFKGSSEPRRARKIKAWRRLGGASYNAKLIKMCDRIDNLHDMAGMMPGFKAMYAEESEHLLSWIGEDMPRELQDEFVGAIMACKDGAKEKP